MRKLCRLLIPIAFLSTLAQAQVQTLQFKVMLTWSDGARLGDKQDVTGMPGVQGTNRDAAGINPVRGNTVANMSIRIQVRNDMGQVIAESSPSAQGDATFTLVGSVTNTRGVKEDAVYRVRVTGPDIEEENIEGVDPASGDRFLSITIRKRGEKRGQGGGVVSANALKIPGKAEKEYNRGNKALDDKKLPEAIEHFQKAIDLYPKYDLAYNGLGATLVEMKDITGARKAFERSIAVNDKFASGYRNLAKISASEKDYVKAADLLQRSLSLEPLNPEALARLCQFDYLLGKDTEVPELARKLHSLPHDGMELAHYAAASSLERMNKPDEAIGEYTLFIKEAPNSNLVTAAKASIDRCRQKLNEPTTQ
jgi:outer membrane protein assembly factor BamD (BamD/ComL family)